MLSLALLTGHQSVCSPLPATAPAGAEADVFIEGLKQTPELPTAGWL